jgi:tripartite-type tricarboxylate transporter receptor subunit TctC
LLCVALASGTVRATPAPEAWPARPVRLIVAQAPGGPPDLIARKLAEPLGRALRVPLVVENHPGASGVIGVRAAAHAAPDGYTLLVGTLSTQVLVPLADAQAGYDPLRDFVPVANLFRSVKVLWVHGGLPVRTLADWIAAARRSPDRFNFASGGVGSSNHVDMALFQSASGIELVHVPYNGPAAAIASVAGGDTQAMIASVGTGLALARAGRIRPLAVFAAERAPQFPEVPTAAELGYGKVDLSAWIGVLAPAGTPAPAVARLNAEIAAILRHPDTADWARRQGLEVIGGAPEAFAATQEADLRRWGDALGRLGHGRH